MKYGDYHKEYNLKHKEKIKKYQTRKVLCECGKMITYANLCKHKKTAIHNHIISRLNNN